MGKRPSALVAGEQAILGEYISRGLAQTRLRMKDLGLDEDAILDPDGSIDQQAAVLRLTFLEAERSGIPFRLNGDRFWRIIRARLQPIVLAYFTHETFVRNLDANSFELRSDTLLDVYKERLNNSDKFRSFFFDLNEKLNNDAGYNHNELNEVELDHQLNKSKPASDITLDPSGDMQKNIVRSLEKQLQDLEKKYNKLEKKYSESVSESEHYKIVLQDKSEDLDRVNREKNVLEEEMIHLKLSADARDRSKPGSPVEIQDDFSLVVEPNSDSDELKLKINALEQELATTSDAAYSAFMSNSDLGIIILFFMTSFRCHSSQYLAEEVVKSVSTFGFESVVGIKNGLKFDYYPSQGISSDGIARLKGAVQSRKPHPSYLTLLRDDCCLLLEHDFSNDLARFEQVKDNLGTLMKGVQARYESIVSEGAALNQKRKLDALIVRSHDVFRKYELNVAKQQVKIAKVVNTYAQDSRAKLEIRPGESKSILFNSEVKKLESSIRSLFNLSELMDKKFVDNINKVAQTILNKKN